MRPASQPQESSRNDGRHRDLEDLPWEGLYAELKREQWEIKSSNQKSGKKLDRLANPRRTKQHTARLPNTEKKNLKEELETILKLSKQKVQSLLNMRTAAAREKLYCIHRQRKR